MESGRRKLNRNCPGSKEQLTRSRCFVCCLPLVPCTLRAEALDEGEALLLLWMVVLVLWAAYWLYTWWHRARLRRQVQRLSQSWEAGRNLVQQQKWPEAVAALDRALTLVKREPTLEADLHFYKGYALEQMQQPEQAIIAYAACRASDAGRLASKYRPLATFRQGYLLAQLERWEEAERALKESIKEARRSHLPGLHLSTLRILLGVYQATHRYAQAVECAEEALRLAHSLRDEPTEAFILDIAGDIHLALGQTEDALRNYEQSLDLFRKLGHARAGLVVKQDIGKFYQISGDWDKASDWLHTCLLEEERAQNLASQARICYDIACLHISKGELDEAAGLLQRSMALFRQVRDKAGADQVGRTLMGLAVLMHRRATADQMTFRDIERGLAKLKKEEEK